MWTPILSLLLAAIISYFSIPPIISLSLLKKLYDKPDERKLHDRRTTALGGIAIFGAFLFSFIFFTNNLPYPQQNSILCAYIILFASGIKDDLYPLSPFKKIITQVLAVLIVIVQGNVRIESLYGLFELHELSYLASVSISLVTFLLLINSFNFIDGINGLSTSLGVITLCTFAYWFWKMEASLFLILCLSYTGALLGFLPYNFKKKARIFMGDSGSLILGFNLSLITIFFIQESVIHMPNFFFAISSAVYAYAILIIPIFDTFRVVFIRITKGKSPFFADRNHIHHALLDLGLSHRLSTMILVMTSIFFIALATLLKDLMSPKYQLIIFTLLIGILSQIPFFLKRHYVRSAR